VGKIAKKSEGVWWSAFLLIRHSKYSATLSKIHRLQTTFSAILPTGKMIQCDAVFTLTNFAAVRRSTSVVPKQRYDAWYNLVVPSGTFTLTILASFGTLLSGSNANCIDELPKSITPRRSASFYFNKILKKFKFELPYKPKYEFKILAKSFVKQ